LRFFGLFLFLRKLLGANIITFSDTKILSSEASGIAIWERNHTQLSSRNFFHNDPLLD